MSNANLFSLLFYTHLGSGASGPGGPEFGAWAKETEEKEGIQFLKSVADLPPVAEGKNRLALISGRTADNPRLLTESIAHGSKCIYLEKPGAPTVAELEQMRDEAEAAGVEVLMGYNKNVCKYVRKTREFAATVDGSHVTFVSNNAYENTPESLGECFERECRFSQYILSAQDVVLWKNLIMSIFYSQVTLRVC